MYKVVEFRDLLPRRRYHVRMPGSTEYHVGYFCDYDISDVSPKRYAENSVEIAVFRHVDRFPSADSFKLYTVSYEYFDERNVFKRRVYEEEQARVRRHFFEKRVVNQIVSHLIGHAVLVY